MTQADYFIPAPTGGLNARDPLLAMPETDAHEILNIFPDTESCRLKGGRVEVADVGASTVHTLAVCADSTSEKLMCVSGTAATDVTGGGAGVAITGAATITDGIPWQFCMHKNTLVLVNGTDAPMCWTGSGNVSTPNYTGATEANFINVSSYKARIYFVLKSSTSMYYPSAVDIDPGTAMALTEFNFQYLLTKGGTLVFTGSTTKQTGYIDQELFVAVSSQGEVLVYQGSYPGDASWSIVGRFFVGKPVGYRCGFYIGSDLHLITQQGIVPMSELLSNVDVNNQYLTVSGKVARKFTEAAVLTGTDSKYWCGAYAPNYRYSFVSLIYETGGSTYTYQYVMNNITKAWTVFDEPAYSWAVWNDVPYFGSIAGKVFKADQLTGADTQTITWYVSSAYNPLGAPRQNKKIQLIQPLVGALYSSSPIEISAAMLADFNSSTDTATLSMTAAATETINRETFPLTSFGKFHSLKYSGANANNTQLRLFGSWATFEAGGSIA